MRRYRILNNITGWFCFAVAFITYLLTAEPTVSPWDCGEFITAADKLEVGHPPGAPMFLLMARMFAIVAPNAAKVAWMVNVFSALTSAFTILFLCWSITHIARRVCRVPGSKEANFQASSSNPEISNFVILASGAIGALAYAFSDTFWFSAVESEVYGASSFFTAIVFWAMLKWEEAANQPYANRWLVLIAYLIGLSIGVHLLSLLAIPAMVLVYYFRKYEPARKGVILAILCSGLILGGILYGIIPWVVKIAGYFELLFVNTFGMPYNTGVLIYILLLLSAMASGIRYTYTRRKQLMNTILLSVTVIIIGYSSYSMIVIRSLANPPMDENSPDNVFALMEYLNREQYGDRPFLYGQYYNAPEEGRRETAPAYARLNGRYEIVQRNVKIDYDSRFCTLFPRMYSPDPSHIEMYKSWGKIRGRPVRVTGEDGKDANLYKPTFFENLRFFFTYQLGHMYGRYFMWNFAGRQNDVQADGSILNGNWISGVPFMDTPRIGPQDNLPAHMKNDAGRNRYFMLPLILGLTGLLWQLQRDVKYFWVVMALFVMTGIAIVIFLNQTPLQPRERDYAYAGSFYAFAIWIGLGVAAIYDMLSRKIPVKGAAVAACLLSISIPAVLVQQNCHDHDRSGRYITRDIAYNYLNSCAPNAILFTVGDNDTFPLWYLQEVEGVRTDVRVVNLMLLRADWYISQMKLASYDSPPLPVTLPEEKYLRGRRDVVYAINRFQDTIPLQQALDFIDSDDPHTKLIPEPGMELDYIMSRSFSIPVDLQKALANGTVKSKDAALALDSLPFRIPSSALMKEQWMVLEIIAANNWERPVYWTSCKHSGTVGLDDYMQLEGAAYRLVPIRTPAESILNTGHIDSDILYDRLMNTFRWNGINDPKVWLDSHHLRTLTVVRARYLYTRLAMQLLAEDRKDRAEKVLSRGLELFPPSRVPYDFFSLLQAEALYQAEMTGQANTELTGYADQLLGELAYFYSLSPDYFGAVQQKAEMNVDLLRRIMDISGSYGQNQIGEHIEQSLEHHR
ncbi:MAG: DUF2723 domain-containing protein [Bacteroidales bacterium]|jgi:hypothetical protein|nr:DUF2723 domain-containing protein [Bacteroidales bacterium]